jgi:hypothetical protein
MEPNPIISIPRDRKGEPIEGVRYKILKRTDGKFIVFDKMGKLGKCTAAVSNGSVKAIETFNKLEKFHARISSPTE